MTKNICMELMKKKNKSQLAETCSCNNFLRFAFVFLSPCDNKVFTGDVLVETRLSRRIYLGRIGFGDELAVLCAVLYRGGCDRFRFVWPFRESRTYLRLPLFVI